jgi:hypothetical protein
MGDFIYFILLQCMRACFCCNVFHEMYLRYSNTCPSWFSTPSKTCFRPWLTEQQAGISDKQGIVTDREEVTGTIHSFLGWNKSAPGLDTQQTNEA